MTDNIIAQKKKQKTDNKIATERKKNETKQKQQKQKQKKDKQRSTKHTYKTKDRVTRTPLKTGGELMCSTDSKSVRSISYIFVPRVMVFDQHILRF
jgi:hypothetical protein